VLILIRSTLLALDQANKTGNYTVLRDLGSAEFQANSAARLAEIFAQHRRDNLDLSGVAVIDPQLTVLPQIEPNGMMRMAGFFPSVPAQVNFELVYAPMGGRWRFARRRRDRIMAVMSPIGRFCCRSRRWKRQIAPWRRVATRSVEAMALKRRR
jgi:hypothetical protein